MKAILGDKTFPGSGPTMRAALSFQPNTLNLMAVREVKYCGV